MGSKLEDLFKRLRRERAPSFGFARSSEESGGEKMLIAAVLTHPKTSAVSSAVSAGAKMVLIHGNPEKDSKSMGRMIKAAGSALCGTVTPDLGDEPNAALAALSKIGAGFVVIEPDNAPARALNGEGPELVVRFELGGTQPSPSRLTTELDVSGVAISLLKQSDVFPLLSMTDLALLKQFCANSRRPVIFLAHDGVRPDDVQLLYDHGVECIAVNAGEDSGSVASYVEAVRQIAPGPRRRQSDDMVALLPKTDISEPEEESDE